MILFILKLLLYFMLSMCYLSEVRSYFAKVSELIFSNFIVIFAIRLIAL